MLAIFSFLDRNFNHREIGAIRKGAKPRYVRIAAASVPEVEALLYQYSKLAALAEQLGFYATTYTEAQVRKAVEIFKTRNARKLVMPRRAAYQGGVQTPSILSRERDMPHGRD